MSHEIKVTLQSILDSISNPACVKINDEIVLCNKKYQEIETHPDDQVKNKIMAVDEKIINENMKLCEYINNDVFLLRTSKQKLAKAMALL